MPEHIVTITRTGNNQIIIQPVRLSVPYQANIPPQTLVWQAVGGPKITGITILNGDGSITTPVKVSDTRWEATDTNGNTSGSPKVYTYAIAIDPEIVNESKPPGGAEEWEKGPGLRGDSREP